MKLVALASVRIFNLVLCTGGALVYLSWALYPVRAQGFAKR